MHKFYIYSILEIIKLKNMMDQIISQEGYDKLKKELDELINIKRLEISSRIESAKELGDLSENAEYHEAKEEQAFNDGRIAEISILLKNLTIVEINNKKDEIAMGSKIVAESNGGKKQYKIVSFNEVDPTCGKISNESPLGRAFLGKKKGEDVVVNTPKGEMKYKIIKIE